MSRIKGTDIVALRKIFAERGEETNQKFISTLPDDLKDMYQVTLFSTWSPVEQQTALYVKAAETLFPDDTGKMCKLGRAMADKSYSSVYKFFLKIPSVEIVINMAAKVWGTYFDTGKASTEKAGNKEVFFIVKNYPELPAPMREVIGGNVCSILEFAGAKNVQVQHISVNPMDWRWLAKWE